MGRRRRVITGPDWTEARIALILSQRLLGRVSLAVPNCNWTGYECDLLVIEKKLRIIDVEIKISRADLKADRSKSKWWINRPWSRRNTPGVPETRRWPDKVWKHYYAMPRSIWDPVSGPSWVPADSGVILVTESNSMVLARVAKPNPKATPITPSDAIDLARLASIRMWAVLAAKGNP